MKKYKSAIVKELTDALDLNPQLINYFIFHIKISIQIFCHRGRFIRIGNFLGILP